MNAKPNDHRPKVISFPTTLDGLNIAGRENILWPCHAFNISIPQKKKNLLNVFEETVLKITEIESGDTKKISDILCLNEDTKGKKTTALISFIQSRLQNLGLINKRNELTGEGIKLLESWRNNKATMVEYIVGTIFVDLISGNILPYIHVGSLQHENIISINERYASVELGSTGKSKIFSCRKITLDKNSNRNVKPGSNDIIRAIREFKKRYKRRALLNQDVEQYPPYVPMAEAISLQDNPELVYLHCQALIQRGNSDLLVTDGCGFGFSEIFASYLTSQNWQWVIDLKRKGVIDKLSFDQSNEETEEEASSGDGLKKYPHIARPLRRAHEYLTDAEKIEVDSSNDENEFVRLIGLAVVALYEAIEWALRFVVSDNPVAHWEHLFSSQSYRENDKILRLFATKIGFDVSDSVKHLLQVKPGKIRAVDRGVSEMQPLLALAIAGAINDPNHPLNHLAVEDSGSLSFINVLKEVRDPVSHGSSKDIELSAKNLEGYCDRTVRLIRALIPDITEDAYTSKTKHYSDIDQVRLKARIELDKSLGLGFVQAVSPSLREELIKIAIFSQEKKLSDDQKKQYVFTLASIMQLSLLEAAKDRKSTVKISDNLRDSAIEKIVQAGFYPAQEAIPKSISTVNTKRLYRAVEGSSETLGAHLLAVFLLGSENELIQLRKAEPTIVDFTANLIRLRGHANEQQNNLSNRDIDLLRNNVFKIIKTITEVF